MTTGASATASGGRNDHDPCSLLEPREVEAVMGPLAGPPFRTHDSPEDNAPDADGKPMHFNPSPLWIQVLPANGQLEY